MPVMWNRHQGEIVKIFRGPKSTGVLDETDTKSIKEYVSNWHPDSWLEFDATKNKSGGRHTSIGVQVSEQDIISLHAGLVKYYRGCLQERDQLQASVNELEGVLEKISSLIASQKGRSPNELLKAIDEVAFHFRFSSNRGKPYKSPFKWLKWGSL